MTQTKDKPTSIQERAAEVLREIDAALELAEKATPGPWEARFSHNSIFGPINQVMQGDGNGCFLAINACMSAPGDDPFFIAASRNGWPKTLRALKTAIEGLLEILACGILSAPATAQRQLTTILDQWEAAK